MMSMTVAASTQVAMAKYPLRSRETSHHSGSAATPQPTAATGSAANGEIPLMARISTKYAPSPTNACCPTDTRPGVAGQQVPHAGHGEHDEAPGP